MQLLSLSCPAWDQELWLDTALQAVTSRLMGFPRAAMRATFPTYEPAWPLISMAQAWGVARMGCMAGSGN